MTGTEKKTRFAIWPGETAAAIFAPLSYKLEDGLTGVAARFYYPESYRLVPFTHGVIGGAHANTTNSGFLGADNAFAHAGGGDFTCFRQN